jgi:hypothetical protein
MVSQPEAQDAIVRGITNDSRMPDELDTITQEADGSGRDAQKTLPLLLVVFDSTTKPQNHNSEFIGYEQDANGDDIARIYERQWEAEARIELWTADGSEYNIDSLSDDLVAILYGYEARATDDYFPDENGDPIKELWNFELTGGGREDDLVQTPTVRRWRQTATVYGTEFYTGPEQPPIKSTNQSV